MAGDSVFDSVQAKEIEEQLFATLRLQSERSVPVNLPRTDFWEKVGLLLDSIESDVVNLYRDGGPDLRLQTLIRRQQNVRRVASELARKRLVALLQHSASQSLKLDGRIDVNRELPALDWNRHDPAERQFYHDVAAQVDRFKQTINWDSMVSGLSAETNQTATSHAPGTMQLDGYVDSPGGLTGRGPPPIEMDEIADEVLEEEIDEEERIARLEAYPELDNQEPEIGVTHAIAPELVPSKKVEFTIEETEEEEMVDENLVRIRIIESSDEAIITADGELNLSAGDVHFLDSSTAQYLIDANVAQLAEL